MKDINENKLISPQVISKSALFSISTATAKNRNRVKDKVIFNHANMKVCFSGYELTVRDEDVLLALLQQAEKHTSLSYEMSLKELTKIAFNRDDTKARRMFKESIDMLYEADVKIVNKEDNVIMNSRIIYSKAYKANELFKVRINEDMRNLLTISNYQIKSLRYKFNNLTKKIYSYVSSNSSYAYVSIDSLYKLTGSTKKRIDPFKQACLDAFEELKSEGVISQYKITNNTIHYTVKSFYKASYKQAIKRNIENELNTQEHFENMCY